MLLQEIPYILNIDYKAVETNIFKFSLAPDYLKTKKLDHNGFCSLLREKHDILMNAGFTNDSIRIVTHRDFFKKQIEQVVKVFKGLA